MIAFVFARDPARDVVGSRFSVAGSMSAKTGRGADARDRLGRRVEGEGGADRPRRRRRSRMRVEDEHDRVGAVRDADRLLDAEVLGSLALEPLDLGAEDEAPALERAREGRLQLRDERRVLRLDVNVRNRPRDAMVVERRRRTRRYAREGDDRRDDHVLDVRKPWSRLSQLGPQRPARSGERKAPERSCRSPSGRCTGRSGTSNTPAGIETNERTTGVTRPSEHRLVLPAVEPALGAVELAGAEVEPAAVALEERPAAVERRSPSRRSRRAR